MNSATFTSNICLYIFLPFTLFKGADGNYVPHAQEVTLDTMSSTWPLIHTVPSSLKEVTIHNANHLHYHATCPQQV